MTPDEENMRAKLHTLGLGKTKKPKPAKKDASPVKSWAPYFNHNLMKESE